MAHILIIAATADLNLDLAKDLQVLLSDLGQEAEILELEKLKLIIITSENADEVFKKMKEQGIDPVIFGLSDNDFQLLAKNFAHIRAHMMKLNIMIDEYKNYYESDVINNEKETKKDKK